MDEPATAPVTAEGLRERLIARLDGEPLFGAAETVDALLAELSGDPGDLPARMADAMRAHGLLTGGALPEGHGTCTCGSWTGTDWVTHLAKVAVSVRWEHAASQAAEVERLRTALAATRSDVDAMQREVHRHVLANAEQQGKVERLRAELAEEKVDNKGLRDRLYYANADATRAEAERDALKAAIETGDVARFAADVHRLVADYSNEERGVIALMPFEATLDQLCLEKYGFDLEKVAALDAPETPRDAETEDSDG